MKLDINEIIGLNSLLDGEQIWGFPETIDKSDSNYVDKMAKKIMSHGKEHVDYLLYMLDQYKKSGSYIVINQINMAKTAKGWIILAKDENAYHLYRMDHEILGYALTKEIGIFQRTNQPVEGVETENADIVEIVKEKYEQIGPFVFFIKYEKWKMRDFNIIYELNGKRNVYNPAKKKNYPAGDTQIDELIRRYMDQWE